MKYREILLEQLKTLPYFSKKTIHQLSEQYGLKSTTVDSYISRSLKYKDIISLKNGVYVTADFYDKNKNDISYSFYLANILRTPSYISSWTALQHYNLTTEAIHTVISITPKVTRSYETKAGNFVYQNLKKNLFSNFVSVKGKPELPTNKFDFFIATPSKALFDLLYLKTRQFRGVNFENIKPLIEELRIDLDEMNQTEQDNLFSMIKNYLRYE
ncbi:MAG: hypothetical protein Q7S66_00965 [bacterium]|nr:hypothetical protein [bacterium]